MAIKFFWRCEGTTMSATDDLPFADDTVTLNGSASISSTSPIIGSNSLETVGSAATARLDLAADDITTTVGTIAGWVRVTSIGNNAFFYARGTSFDYNITIYTTAGGELRLRINDGAGDQSSIDTSGANLQADTNYFFTASWNSATNSRRIAVYNSSGTLIVAAEDTSTAFAAPTDLTQGDGLRIGDNSGAAVTWKLDNIFIGGAYSDYSTFLSNRSITSYTQYTVGGGVSMVAEQGSYSLTGQTVNLITGGFLTAESGSYSLLGSEALRDVTVAMEQGSYALNGQAVPTVVARTMIAAQGSYSLLGQAINVLYSGAASLSKALGRGKFFGFRLSR